MENLFIYLTLL